MKTLFQRSHLRMQCAPLKSGTVVEQGAFGRFSVYSRGGGESSPRNVPGAWPRTLNRGSALLIVLGFLSFMTVSAVSFAIYMRIERQASSNYRHATTGRHMLNAALFRAIDEIDSELRIDKLTKGPDTDNRPRKFPEWPGRVKPSAVPNGLDNDQEARVLSAEALSFIPGILVNDVRRYAVTNQNDSVNGLSDTKASYLGAKWRTLSMPVSSLGSESSDAANAYEEAIVGRYAYVCVNVSDMLDVNLCKATVRNAVTNRVSIGNVFGIGTVADNAREAFDQYVENEALKFETLQDFYACMDAKKGTSYGRLLGSPYHEYMHAGRDEGADDFFQEAANHILVTDSLAGAQPANATACNILLQQPISPGDLNIMQTPSLSFQNATLNGRDGFETALGKTFANRLPPGANMSDVLPILLADYLDKDNIPKALFMPSVELVPMISEIAPLPGFRPEIGVSGDGATPPVYTYSLRVRPTLIQVELVWPFKRMKDRDCPPSSSYDVEVIAYLQVHSKVKKSSGFSQQPSAANGYLKLTGTAKAPDFSAKNDDNQNECYKTVPVLLNPAGVSEIPFVKSDLSFNTTDFVPSDKRLFFSLIVFTRVKQGSTYVDSAPQMLPYPFPKTGNEDAEFSATLNKLYFETPQLPFDAATAAGIIPTVPAFQWNCLEVPDPRFNYKASNWIRNDADSSGIPQENGINPSTLALLGKDGRDGDIFMSVSDVGALQSPSELGFILRPFKYDLVGSEVDFSTRTDVDPSVDDSAAYFRTVRLYDHDNNDASDKITRAKDPIYQYFTAQNADGSVSGARVNPLSDLPLVLSAAVDQTPVDYWFASRDVNRDSEIMRRNTFNKFLSVADWGKFTNAWSQCFINLRNTTEGRQMKTTWKYGLPDYYGDFDKFGWYSEGDPLVSFAPRGFSPKPAGITSLSNPLHEIDRKMLYSFSLDSFSDRQQLFLYILRAEVTVPSFGSSKESGTKSLAGGRAVALVWRDPYPEGYDKDSDSWLRKNWYSTPRRLSPWYQVNIDKYDSQFEAYDTDNSINQRSDGFHQHKILFFKQLDN